MRSTVLPDGRIRIGDATFSEIQAGFRSDVVVGGTRCLSGGYPHASVKVACDASASAPCEYLVGVEFRTETGRRFGGESQPRPVSVPPGEEKPVDFGWPRSGCYSNEHATAVDLSVKEAGGEGRRTKTTIGLTK
jgi:hypothetical protein